MSQTRELFLIFLGDIENYIGEIKNFVKTIQNSIHIVILTNMIEVCECDHKLL